MKIALLTYFSVNNTGQFFQALASLQALKTVFPEDVIELVNIRHERRAVWLPPKSLVSVIPSFKRHFKYEAGRRKEFYPYLGATEFKRPSGEELEKYLNEIHADVVITGADTCLKVDTHWNGKLPPYWIPAGVKGKTFFLSGSAENTVISDMNPEQIKQAKECLKHLSLIYARDEMTKNLMLELLPEVSNKIDLVPDPTFSLTLSNKESNIFLKLKKKGKPLCAVNLPATEVTLKLITELSKDFTVFSLNRSSINGELSFFLGPEDWLNMWNSIDYLVTTSFHESIFALRSGVPFIAVDVTKDRAGKEGGKSKIGDLLTRAGLIDLYASLPPVSMIPELIRLLKSSKEKVQSQSVKDFCTDAGKKYLDAVKSIRAKVV